MASHTHDDVAADFWQFVAPDPRCQPAPAPPSTAFPNLMDNDETRIECEHCHCHTRVPTSVLNGTTNKSTSSASGTNTVTFSTPSPRRRRTADDNSNNGTDLSPPPSSSNKGKKYFEDKVVDALVVSASKDTAMAFSSPKLSLHQMAFRYCASTIKLGDKKLESIRKWIRKDHTLLEARAVRLGVTCPEGYTLLMATAYVNHLQAAEIIMDEAKPFLTSIVISARDYLGKSALHIAAEHGNVEMVQFLLPFYHCVEEQREADIDSNKVGSATNMASGMPLDILGRTPLGSAITSPNPKAKSQKKKFETVLFSPNDESIMGRHKPYEERMGMVRFAITGPEQREENAALCYGMADMPGMRVDMEDAICNESWSTNLDVPDDEVSAMASYCLLGVCDGHGDRGAVSEFVATNVAKQLKECMGPGEDHGSEDIAALQEYWAQIWYSAAIKVDDSLRTEGLSGGSTGVFALISRDTIVVANVGDSRCILIQMAALEEGSSELCSGSAPEELSPQAGAVPPALTTLEGGKGSKAETTTIVVALSEDHKPNAQNEVDRIENAGLKVETFTIKNDDGTEETISKVIKSDKDQLAVSRAFGDFDYKTNTTLGPHEQAVCCTPDVMIHKRDVVRDLYLVLCCDGIFDVMENEDVKDFVIKQVKAKKEAGIDIQLPEIGDELCRKCFELGSRDNMSAIVVSLQPKPEDLQSPRLPPKSLDFTSPPST